MEAFWQPQGAAAPGLRHVPCLKAGCCGGRVVSMTDLHALSEVLSRKDAPGKFSAWVEKLAGWGLRGQKHGYAQNHLTLGEGTFALLRGLPAGDCALDVYARAAIAQLNGIAAPPPAGVPPGGVGALGGGAQQQGGAPPSLADTAAAVKAAASYAANAALVALDSAAFQGKMRKACEALGTWNVAGAEGAPQELKLLFDLMHELTHAVMPATATAASRKRALTLARTMAWQVVKQIATDLRSSVPLPLQQQMGYFAERTGVGAVMAKWLTSTRLMVNPRATDRRLDRRKGSFFDQPFISRDRSLLEVLDNGNVQVTESAPQAAGTAAHAEALREAYDVEQEGRKQAAAARQRAAAARAAGNEAAAVVAETEADALDAQLGPEVGALKDAYAKCGCKSKCVKGRCACTAALEACGPKCACAGDCESPFSKGLRKYQAAKAKAVARSLPAPPTLVALGDPAAKNKAYRRIDWVNQADAEAPTVALDEAPDSASLVPDEERSWEKSFAAFGLQRLSSLLRGQDARYLRNALDLQDAGDDLFAEPEKHSAIEASVDYWRADVKVQPVKKAKVTVLPVGVMGNPSDTDTLAAQFKYADSKLSALTGRTDIALPPSIDEEMSTGEEDSDEEEEEQPEDAVPLPSAADKERAVMEPHCSRCGHPGNIRSHKKHSCETCCNLPGSECTDKRAEGASPCSCAAHVAIEEKEAAAADEAAATDVRAVPETPWLAWIGLWTRLHAGLHDTLEQLVGLVVQHATPDVDGTVTQGVGAVKRAAAEALRVVALELGRTDDTLATRLAKAEELAEKALAEALKLDAAQRSPFLGGGIERVMMCGDEPIYRTARLYLQLRHLIAKRILFPGGLHTEMALGESLGHNLRALGLDEVVLATSMTTIEALENCHADIERALEVYRALYAALRLDAWRAFLAEVSASQAQEAKRARDAAYVRVEPAPPQGASIGVDVFAADLAAARSSDEPYWLSEQPHVRLSTDAGFERDISAAPGDAMLKALTAAAAELRAEADVAAAPVLNAHYVWMFGQKTNPTAAALLQFASLAHVFISYHEMTRAGPLYAEELATLESLSLFAFAADKHKVKYQQVAMIFNMDRNQGWTANEQASHAQVVSLPMSDNEGGHNVAPDGVQENTMLQVKRHGNNNGNATETTITRATASVTVLEGAYTQMTNACAITTSSSHRRPHLGAHILEMYAVLKELDAYAQTTELRHLRTLKAIPPAERPPATETQRTIGNRVIVLFNSTEARLHGPPPPKPGGKKRAGLRLQDRLVDIDKVAAQAEDKAEATERSKRAKVAPATQQPPPPPPPPGPPPPPALRTTEELRQFTEQHGLRDLDRGGRRAGTAHEYGEI